MSHALCSTAFPGPGSARISRLATLGVVGQAVALRRSSE